MEKKKLDKFPADNPYLCPECGSENVVFLRDVETFTWAMWKCKDCGASWDVEDEGESDG